MLKPTDHYLADKVLTATPAQLTGMLFDAAVASLRGAIRLQGEGQWQAALPKVIKAQNIVMELRSSLNHEAGGRLAADLDQLYAWSFTTLVRSTSARDPQGPKDVLAVIEPLAEGWREGVLGAVPVAA